MNSEGQAFPTALRWSPLPGRAPLTWPGKAPLAVAVVLHVEHVEWLAPDLAAVPPSVVRRPPYPKLFDPHEVTVHEYGNRVGYFRLSKLLAEAAVPATVAIDAASALRYRSIVDDIRQHGRPVIAHGLSASRMLTGAMPQDEQRRQVRTTLDVIENAMGVRPKGWAGVEHAEGAGTPEILAEAGVGYTIDWANDEQPYRLDTAAGDLAVLPIALELDDVYSIHMRRILTSSWADMVCEAVKTLAAGDPDQGRLLVVNIHAWLSGQPFRQRWVRQVLDALKGPGIWCTTLDEVFAHMQAQWKQE